MRKVVFTILSLLLVTVLAFAQIEESKFTIIKLYEKQLATGTPSYQTWKEGCKEQFNLNLQKIKFKVEVIEEVTEDVDVYIRAVIEISALCLDEVGFKKRITTVKDISFKLTDGIIMGAILLEEIKPVLIDGWNEKEEIEEENRMPGTKEQALKAWETRRRNGTNTWTMPEGTAEKAWETRRKNGTDKGFEAWNKGIKGVIHLTDDQKQQISNTMKGKSTAWLLGKPSSKKGNLYSPPHIWRNGILVIFNSTCVKCGVSTYPTRRAKSGTERVCTHHIFDRKLFPEKKYDPNWGTCLCRKCHNTFHQRYGIADSYEKYFQFLRA